MTTCETFNIRKYFFGDLYRFNKILSQGRPWNLTIITVSSRGKNYLMNLKQFIDNYWYEKKSIMKLIFQFINYWYEKWLCCSQEFTIETIPVFNIYQATTQSGFIKWGMQSHAHTSIPPSLRILSELSTAPLKPTWTS